MATLAELQADLAEWETALKTVKNKKSYTMGDRTMTLQDAKEIRDTIDWFEAKIGKKSRGGIRGRGVTFADG
ncbi:MAG: hypothetical protein HON94_04815 [Methylococcales bacterium]|jgi:hypothetical protein|nr:hypothetical protein [Methylococcales bacterium]